MAQLAIARAPVGEWLDKAEAAAYVCVSARSLARHAPPPARVGRRVLYSRAGLDAWLRGTVVERQSMPKASAAPLVLRSVRAKAGADNWIRTMRLPSD